MTEQMLLDMTAVHIMLLVSLRVAIGPETVHQHKIETLLLVAVLR